MKYIDHVPMSQITHSLNFNTEQYHVIGACDMYTTKAVQSDKRLYREICADINKEQEAVKLEYNLNPRRSPDPDRYASLDSDFGPLEDTKNRWKFAYMIGALDSSHDDYEFYDVLKPQDFKRESSVDSVHFKIDDVLMWVKPCPASALLMVPSPTGGHSLSLPDGRFIWCPKMWDEMDNQMDFENCEIYSCKALEAIFNRDDHSVFCIHYLFYNPALKRVLYFYARVMGLLTHSPPWFAERRARKMGLLPAVSYDEEDEGKGARKRSHYWFGEGDEMEIDDDEGYWDETFNDPEMWEMSDSESDNDEIEKIRRLREKGKII